MRRKLHVAALALASAAAAAHAQAPPVEPPPVEPPPVETAPVETAPAPTAPMPEINVWVTPPDVTIDVDSPFLSMRRDGEFSRFSLQPQGLWALKKHLGDGRWRGALDVIDGPLRARLSRDGAGRFNVFAQSAPAPAPAPAPDPAPSGQPGEPPAEQQRRLLNLYRAQLGGEVPMQKAAYLGVSTTPVPAPLRQHLGLQEGVGLVAEFIEEGSPAAKAGLKQYDILNKLDDQLLVNAHQLAVLVRARKAGDTVKLSITRGGKSETISATLVEKEVKSLDAIEFWNAPGGGSGQFRFNRLEDDDMRNNWEARWNANRAAGAGATSNGSGNQNRRSSADVRVTERSGERKTMVLTDDDYQLILTVAPGNPDERHLVAVEKASGKVLFDGKIPREGGGGKLPPGVAERLKQLDEAGKPGSKNKPGKPTGEGPGKREEQRFEVRLGQPGKPPKIKEGKDDVRFEEREKDDDNDNNNDNNNDNDNDNDNDNYQREEKDEDILDAKDDDDDAPKASASLIRGGDVVELSVTDLVAPGVETVKQARVRDGKVSLPYVGQVKAEGLTERQLERSIVSAYRDARLNASVSVRRIAAGDARDTAGEEPAPPKP